MVRWQAMTRAREEDFHSLAFPNLPSHLFHHTILQSQGRCLRVDRCDGALHNSIWWVLQGHSHRDTDETGRHDVVYSPAKLQDVFIGKRPPLIEDMEVRVLFRRMFRQSTTDRCCQGALEGATNACSTAVSIFGTLLA